MLLMRELRRIAANSVSFAWWTGRFWMLVAIVLLAVVALVMTSVTVLGPVVVYPFL
jgi:hypothetical protein